MNKIIVTLLTAGAFISAVASFNATASGSHADHHPAKAVSAAGADKKPEMVSAEVKKIDVDAKKITLKHAEIKSLDMPGMTMVFQVKDAKMLDTVKAGDMVKFSVEQTKSGFLVTSIEAAK